MKDFWCVLVFRNTNPDFPTAILGPFDKEDDAWQAKRDLHSNFHGSTWRMDTEVKP